MVQATCPKVGKVISNKQHGTSGAGRWPRRQNGCLRTMADFKFRKFAGRTSHRFTLTKGETDHQNGIGEDASQNQVLKHPRCKAFAKLKR